MNSLEQTTAPTGVLLHPVVRRWRCTTSRFQLKDPPRNPFLVRIENFGEGVTTTRTYEFDAASEEECRKLFNEAKRDRLMEVEGFTLDKIEEIAPNAELSDPAHRTGRLQPKRESRVRWSDWLGDDDMKYTSNAKWPRMDAYLGNAETTSDEHDTKEQAQAVCDILEREGYGGEGKMFPVKTWVEAKSPNDQADRPEAEK